MKNICKKTIVISIILLLIGVSVSSAATNVVIKNLIDDNQPPNPPDVCGPAQIRVGEYITFTFKAVDPDGDNVSYYVEWGDGTSYGWTSYNPSGQEIAIAHMWEEKPVYMRAKAKDYPYEGESNWTYKYFRGRSRNLVDNSEDDCGCAEVSDTDLVKVESLLNRVEIYSKLLLVLSRFNPELKEMSEELSDEITTLKDEFADEPPFPIICDILDAIMHQIEDLFDYFRDLLYSSPPASMLYIIGAIGCQILMPFGGSLWFCARILGCDWADLPYN